MMDRKRFAIPTVLLLASMGFAFPMVFGIRPASAHSGHVVTSRRFPDNIVPTIDGYFNNAEEWNTTRIVRRTPANDTVVCYLGHDDKYLYVLQDFLTDTKVSGLAMKGEPRDKAIVFIDNSNDGGSKPQIDDFHIDVQWGDSSRNAYFVLRGDGSEWVLLKASETPFYRSFKGKSSLSLSPNSPIPHLVYEFQIPMNFSSQLQAPADFSENSTYGLMLYAYDHDRRIEIGYPFGSWTNIPNSWADLVFSSLSLPAWSATLTIDEAKTSIERAANEGRTDGLDKARLLLDDASAAFKRGEYDLARSLAEQARDSARRAVFPKIYHEAKELLAKAQQLRSAVAASTYSSPEAQGLLRQALLACDTAELSFLRKEFNVAADSARSAIALFEKAALAEQRHREAVEAQRQLSNYIVVGSVLCIGLAAAYVLRRRAHQKPQR